MALLTAAKKGSGDSPRGGKTTTNKPNLKTDRNTTIGMVDRMLTVRSLLQKSSSII